MGKGRAASLTPASNPGDPHKCRQLCLTEAGWVHTPLLSGQPLRGSQEDGLRQGSSQTQGTPNAKDEGTLRGQTSWQGSLCPSTAAQAPGPCLLVVSVLNTGRGTKSCPLGPMRRVGLGQDLNSLQRWAWPI